MTNRVQSYLPDEPHPLDTPEMQGKTRAVRLLCTGLIVVCCVVIVGVVSTVTFALGGRALPKNGAMLGGIPILTVIGAVLTLSAVTVASIIVPFSTRSGLKTIATTPATVPEVGAELETEPERLFNLYSKTKFIEYALPEGAAVVTAILFHLSADPLMIAFAAGMVVFMLVRFPTLGRMKAWYDDAAVKLEDEKRNATGALE